MSVIRALGALGTAARGVRRVGLGRALSLGLDATDRALLRGGLLPLETQVDGIELRGYLRHRGFLDYVARGMPEESFYRSLLVGAVDRRTTFVDAGAHIGVYTVLASRRARRVIAFEPNPYNLAALRRNVDAASCANVEIRAQAIADRTGRGTFRAFRSTLSGSLLPREVDQYREIETETIALDDVLSQADLDRLVVKIDVEGAEPLALLGMHRALREARALFLFIEVNPEALAAGGWTPSAVIDELLAMRLECAFICEFQQNLLVLQKGATIEKGNLACWRGSTRPHFPGAGLRESGSPRARL
jgi:FkbM family methyltransferase